MIRNLIDCASKGGNYLLNIGPTSEGLFPAPSIERLAAIGDWMKVNHEAIYGTTASAFKKLSYGRCTQKPGKLYLHVFDWPADGRLLVPIANPVRRAYLLAARNQRLRTEKTDAGQVLIVPATAPDLNATVVVVELEGKPEVLATASSLKQTADGTLVLNASNAELVGSSIKLETKTDNVPNIGYWVNQNDFVQWPVVITRPGLYDLEVSYACEPDSAGSECVLAIGSQEYSRAVEATQGWGDFQTATLGQLQIDQTGPITISLKATNKPGLAVVNLRHLTFRPVN